MLRAAVILMSLVLVSGSAFAGASRKQMSIVRDDGRRHVLKEYHVDLIEYNVTTRRNGEVVRMILFWYWNPVTCDYEMQGWRCMDRVTISADRLRIESVWNQEYVIIGKMTKDTVNKIWDPDELYRSRFPKNYVLRRIPWDVGVFTCLPFPGP